MKRRTTRRARFNQLAIAWALRLLLIACVLCTSIGIMPAATPEVLAQTTTAPCVNTGPGSWVARLCITAPADGATLRGNVTTTVTVTPVSGTVPAVKTIRFYLNKASGSQNANMATDFLSPFSLQIPTAHWVDDTYRLEAVGTFADGYVGTTKALILVKLQNGVTKTPSSAGTWTPKTSGASPLNILAAGDGAGGLPGATAVGNLAQGLNPDLFLYLGDVYNAGTYTEYVNYYDPTLGPLKGRTNPVVGNHETGSGYLGYRDYWDASGTYYSFDSGGWHFIALDSNVDATAGSAQYNWLSQDLMANSGTACTLVYYHHPRFGLDTGGGSALMQDAWSLMALNGVDIVLNGHEHNYQRWLPMNANGQLDANGITEYVAGTAGHEQIPFALSDSRVASRLARTDGVLSLTLGAGGGSTRFITSSGAKVDEHSFNCMNGPGSVTPTPTTPTTTPDPTTPLALEPVADALVSAANPTTNYGTSTSLRSDLSPNEESYLKFDVQGLTAPATKATLRLYVRDSTVNAPYVATAADSSWTEKALTWNTKPAVGSSLSDLGTVQAGVWIEYDVTSAIKANGLVTFALIPQSSDALSVNSRENTSNRPQLIIERAGATVTPTVTSTVTPTPSTSLPFLPAADARVESGKPLDNFGTSTVLRTEGGTDPAIETYIRFSVTGLSGAPTSATLRFWVPTNSSAGSVRGPALYTASSNSWSETGISWANRPDRTTTSIGSLGAVAPGTWVEFNVSPVITGNGDYTFVLASTSADATDFSSRETANAPQLVLDVPAGSVTPTVTPTVTTTVTPTVTTTVTPTVTTTVTPTVTTTVTPTTTPGAPLGLEPVEDAMVSAANPTTNYGTASNLRSDLSPNEESYIKFNVQGLQGPATKATLRLYLRDGTTNAPYVAAAADSSWTEKGLTWDTKPAVGPALSDLGAVSTGTWIEYDVTSAVTTNGLITFALIPQSSDAMSANSRNATDSHPQLVIEQGTSNTSAPARLSRALAPAVVSTPTPAPTQAGTPAPSATATGTSTPAPTATATSTPLTGMVVGTGGQGLRCRADASADSTILTVIAEGQTVEIRGPQEGDWLPITCDGQNGYGAAAYIVIATPGAEATPTETEPAASVISQTPATVGETATETPTESTASPTETATPEPTPLPITNGWQDDPSIPWWLMTDQDLTTTWSGYVADAQSPVEVGFDLGVTQPIDHIRWQPTWPMQGLMEIQLSDDGVTWYRLESIDLTREQPDQWAEIPIHVQARYINLVFTDPNQAGTVGAIREMEFWADTQGYVPPLETLPVITPTPAPVEPTQTQTPAEIPVVVPTEPVETPTETPVVQQPAPPAPEPTDTPTETTNIAPPPVVEGTPNG